MRNGRGNSSRPCSRCVRRTRSHVECTLSHQLMAQHTTQPEGTASPVPLPQQKNKPKEFMRQGLGQMSKPNKMSPHAASSTGCSFQLCIFQDLPQAAGSLVLEERELAFFSIVEEAPGGRGSQRVPQPGGTPRPPEPPVCCRGRRAGLGEPQQCHRPPPTSGTSQDNLF